MRETWEHGWICLILVMAGAVLAGCGVNETPTKPLNSDSAALINLTLPVPPSTTRVSVIDDEPVETQHFYSGPRKHKPTERTVPVKDRGKVAYLTFDDGPSQSTKKILSILKSFRIPATFFVVGSDTSEGRALYKQMVAEGHTLGNHTYSHDYSTIYKSVEAFRKDVRKLDKLLEDTVGYRPDILRFPGGSNNHLSWRPGGKRIMSKVTKAMIEDGYQFFDWNVSSTDAAAPVQNKDMIIDAVLSASRGKQSIIVLMHDNTFKTTTVEALPTMIKRLQAAGFRFEKLTKSAFTFKFLEP
ncbi:polysaccharide deacetylase family protein [Paenibacillus sp. SYP-B3998]|uniref:polysaccharide deacetylase family protein n=1 Tax=Paenibacillus sp. SYP-B3998 TaxID=2678564 RepID=UPI0013D68C09